MGIFEVFSLYLLLRHNVDFKNRAQSLALSSFEHDLTENNKKARKV